MKRNNYWVLSSLALLASLAACNDDYSDQFNITDGVTDVKNVTMTLAAEDYSSIAGLSTNQELALSMDPETGAYVEALNAVKTQKYFTDMASAEDYIPAFLANKYPNADLGSKFTVTYQQYQAPSGYLADFANIGSYTLTADDYTTVWGDDVKASFLSPASVSKIPSLLKAGVSDAAAGDMVVVNYAYSSVEPSTGGSTSTEEKLPAISEILGEAGDYTVEGTVVATYARGFLLGDGTANILVYINGTANYVVGDKIRITGTTTKYSGLMQFPNTSEITYLGRAESFAYPTAETMTGEQLDSYMNNPSVKYVSFSGTLNISGNYYNIVVDGATRQGSISYPVGGVVDPALNGQAVTVTGYLIGGSSKYVNVMATSVVAQGTTPATTPVGVVAMSEAGDYTVSGSVAATYSRGFLLTDGSGYILVYKSNTGVKQGDIVTVSGTTSAYSGLMQYSSKAEVTITGEGTYKLPSAARALGAADMEAYVSAPYAAYVTYQGTLSISGNYYNIIIDGTTAVQGSLSYPESDVVDAALDGKKVEVTGYAIGASSGKYLNTMVTSVTEVTSTKAARYAAAVRRQALTRAASSGATHAALYQYDGSAWAEYTNSDARVAVFAPSDYDALGSTVVSDPDYVLPIFLARNYPYAAEGDKVAVVYNKKADTPTVTEFTFDGTWAKTPTSVATTTVFMKDADGISANMSIYLNETFLGDEGGFSAQNVTMGSLSYVWTNTSNYGWKASAYANSTYNVSESWLVSPVINFKKATQPMLTFDEVHQYGSGDPETYLFVMISTDYKGDVTTCTWNQLEVPQWSTGSDWTFVNVGWIDLSAYIGGQAVVAFKYTSSSDAAATWEVKNLKLVEASEIAE
jgi:hypothetical protein